MTDIESTDADLRRQVASARARSAPRDAAGRFAVTEASSTSTPAETAEQRQAREFDAELRATAGRPSRVSGHRPHSELFPLPP
jgi:hypothetical protein